MVDVEMKTSYLDRYTNVKPVSITFNKVVLEVLDNNREFRNRSQYVNEILYNYFKEKELI